MKMTDESALAVMQFARGYLTWNNMQEFDDALQHIRARLAADQQKGGGESVAFLTLTEDSVGEEWPQEPLLMLTEAGRKLPPGPYELYTTPQPSIPAPAQQVDLEQFRPAVAAYKFKAECDSREGYDRVGADFISSARERIRTADCLFAIIDGYRAHPPHADQETQG